MHTVTLLIGQGPVDEYDDSVDFNGWADLLNPTEEQIPAITKYEVQCEATSPHGLHSSLLHTVDGLYAQAFFDGFNPNSTTTLVLINGEPSPIAINDHGFDSPIAEPYLKKG